MSLNPYSVLSGYHNRLKFLNNMTGKKLSVVEENKVIKMFKLVLVRSMLYFQNDDFYQFFYDFKRTLDRFKKKIN